MAAPQREAIEMFTSITGASQEVALQKLEEHGGDLNQAINAHFNEGDRTIRSPAASVPEPQGDFMAIDDPNPVEPPGSSFPLLSAARSLNPFSILDPNFRRSFFEGRGGPDLTSPAPFVSNPREVREIPIEFRDVTNHTSHSGSTRPIIEDITESGVPHGPENYGTVLIDEKEDLPVHATSGQSEVKDDLYERRAGPSAPQLYDVTDDGNDIEEEMLRAAIEASKMEVDLGYPTQQFGATDGSSEHQLDVRSPHLDDTELARAVSLSLKTAEQEKALREQEKALCDQQDVVQTARLGVANLSDIEELERLPQANMRQGFGPANKDSSNQSKSEVGGSSNQEETDEVEEPLVRNSSKRVASGSAEASKEVGPVVDSIPSSPQSHDSDTPPQLNGDPFHSEWGGISSEEHDEAVMLEAALFGRIPEGSEYRFGYPPSEMAFPRRAPRPPSPTLTAQRLLREQQDDEYLASLQADREKELKAKADAEAAVELEKQKAEETHRKLLEEEEAVRLLEAKEASLPQEPALDEEAGITLLVRMPDGSRRGRRFRKSDKLQSLFDFIDVGRGVKPGTYRLVRPYPRRAFSDGESEVSLSDLGLTSKQEALFLELI